MVAAHVARVLRDTSRLPPRLPRRADYLGPQADKSRGNFLRLCNVSYVGRVIRTFPF